MASPSLGLPVPPARPGVCAICHGPARDGHPDCWCCRAVSDALSRHGPDVAARPVVVPAAVFRVGDPLHRVLRGYKDAPAVTARRHFAGRLRTHLADFLAAHGECIAAAGGGATDALAVVPSSGRTALALPPGRSAAPGDAAARPLAGVVDTVAALAGPDRVVLRRGPGRTGHLAPHPEAFEVCGDVRGRRVLLLDDTWVTGARMRSAGAALVRGGAVAVTMVAAGRAIDVGARPAVARWWAWAERGGAATHDAETHGAGAHGVGAHGVGAHGAGAHGDGVDRAGGSPPRWPCCLPTCRWRLGLSERVVS